MRKSGVLKVLVLTTALAAWAHAASHNPARGAEKSAAGSTSGIAWETSFEAAQQRAQRERKPILLLHLFGRLDEEFC
jgi:hypothetical protein